jgi:hypothetical protein
MRARLGGWLIFASAARKEREHPGRAAKEEIEHQKHALEKANDHD